MDDVVDTPYPYPRTQAHSVVDVILTVWWMCILLCAGGACWWRERERRREHEVRRIFKAYMPTATHDGSSGGSGDSVLV